jgi:hypothetical protein
VLVVHDLEHEGEKGDKNLGAVIQVEAHVEGLDVGQVFQQVEVTLESGVLKRENKYKKR